MNARDLVDLPLEEALEEKWRRGREKYGPEWAGEHPLIEAHSEALDGVIYCREAARRGVQAHAAARAFKSAALTLRGAIRKLEETP